MTTSFQILFAHQYICIRTAPKRHDDALIDGMIGGCLRNGKFTSTFGRTFDQGLIFEYGSLHGTPQRQDYSYCC